MSPMFFKVCFRVHTELINKPPPSAFTLTTSWHFQVLCPPCVPGCLSRSVPQSNRGQRRPPPLDLLQRIGARRAGRERIRDPVQHHRFPVTLGRGRYVSLYVVVFPLSVIISTSFSLYVTAVWLGRGRFTWGFVGERVFEHRLKDSHGAQQNLLLHDPRISGERSISALTRTVPLSLLLRNLCRDPRMVRCRHAAERCPLPRLYAEPWVPQPLALLPLHRRPRGSPGHRLGCLQPHWMRQGEMGPHFSVYFKYCN